MIVIEFMDAVDTLFTALMAWIAAISAAVTLAGWGLVWVVTRVAKWAWRAARRAWGSTGPRNALSASVSHELPSRDQNPAVPAERRSAPQWAHADKEAA